MIPRLILSVLTALLLLQAACAQQIKTPADGPLFELRRGEKHFRVEGKPAFVLGRNPAGMNPKAFDDHFRHAEAAGERFVRIHFTYSPPEEKAGEIDAGILKAWDAVLGAARKRGLAVLPVLGVWAQWNDGSRGETWHDWHKNAFSADRGGPAKRPDELLEDTPCRKLWFARLEKIVKHWSGHRHVVGWEIFSEVDLITGSTEARATGFVEAAAAVIRAADPLKRPVTASQAGVNEWPKLLKSDALDFIQVHPYADAAGGQLDELILSSVRDRLKKYGKPVLLGECGLDSAPPRGTLDTAPRAEIGIRHAIWASVVSGAMCGRMLWWQDGYDQFEKADLCRHYREAAAPAASFVRGIDFTGFAPMECEMSAGLKGAVVGTDTLRLAWCRDANCGPPRWPVKKVSGEHLTLRAAADAWQVEFFDTASGKSLGTSRIASEKGRLRVELPPFEGSVAARIKSIAP